MLEHCNICKKNPTNIWKMSSFGALIPSFAEGCWTYLFLFYRYVSFTALEHYHFSTSSGWNFPMSAPSPLLYQQLSRDHIKISDSPSSSPSNFYPSTTVETSAETLIGLLLLPRCIHHYHKTETFSTLKVTVINDAHKTKKMSCPDRGIFPTLSC